MFYQEIPIGNKAIIIYMEIGILTFHCAHNYGAVLQCYAMQEFLRNEGYNVEIINYRPKCITQPYVLFDMRRFVHKKPNVMIKRIIKELLILRNRYIRWRGFNKFINDYLLLGEPVNRHSIPSKFDVYIVGSDQIWNSGILGGIDGIYFCEFPFDKKERKYIAYAASKGSANLNKDEIHFYKHSLSKFDYVSVRESDLQEVLQSHMDKPIKCVLDPTLLAPKHIWDNLISTGTRENKYVVVYQVRNHNKTIQIANHIAKQIGADVKILVAWLEINRENMYQDAAPTEFVDLIRNASCVVTTSFHGTAFSVIFNRPFYTVKLEDGADSRSLSLLQSIGLEDRLISVDQLPIFSTIDYKLANEKLAVLCKESRDFILHSLKAQSVNSQV